MSRVDALLKTLQVRSTPPEGLVQAYLIHIGDRSETNFRKMLDLKGVRKQDQNPLVDLFRVHSASHENLVRSSSLLSPIQISTSTQQGNTTMGSSLSNVTPSISGSFDPTKVGSALLSAAREGVDRFGSPVPGSSNLPSRAQSPPQQGEGHRDGGNVSENLRNIGKFFRGDVGFGRFGRGGDEAK